MPRKPGVYWTESWNPATGCTPCSPACDHCWARGMAERLPQIHAVRRMDFAGSVGIDSQPLYERVPFSTITLHPDRLDQPKHWRKPRVAAVSLMGDLFHEDVPREFLVRVWQVMAQNFWQTYLILTKRAERMRQFLDTLSFHTAGIPVSSDRPHPNVWLGVSVWDQESADKNIPILLDTDAAHRWVSIEPCLGDVCFGCAEHRWGMDPEDNRRHLDQVILGCESGPGRRPMPHAWARSIRDQCAEAGVPFYLKQASENEDGTGRVVKEPTLDGKQHLDLAWEAER